MTTMVHHSTYCRYSKRGCRGDYYGTPLCAIIHLGGQNEDSLMTMVLFVVYQIKDVMVITIVVIGRQEKIVHLNTFNKWLCRG